MGFACRRSTSAIIEEVRQSHIVVVVVVWPGRTRVDIIVRRLT